ncbi:MAG: ornithine cyclodeaminase family protein [Burkholderiales bacterium]|nr:ornithine cyclodeaminase family protein [Burkholderiales bacterium]
MLYLTESDVSGSLTMERAVERVAAALAAGARGAAVNVPRERTRTPQGTLHLLQGAAAEVGVVGYKAYYSTPAGTHSHVYLYDHRSGAPLALIEANHFNVVRTGAATGVATRTLAREDASVVGQIGAGRMGAGQLEAVCRVRPIRVAQVYARTRDRLEAFCRSMTARLGIDVFPAESAESAVRGAGIVNVITRSSTPVLAGAWLEPGQHVNAAGSNALTRRELDTDAVRRCEVIALDSRDTARNECGDLLPLVEAGLVHWEALPEIGEIIAGLRPGRGTREQVTLYKSHGMAIQDLYVAAHVLEIARARGLGVEVRA